MSYDANLWNAVLNELRRDSGRVNEMNSKSIACEKGQSLRWYEKVVGNPSYGGYALFICLHGGGQGSAQMNDSQWKDIIPFESGGFQNGTIAVACRGVSNSWKLHFEDQTYPAITRLIEDYIILRGVDPNRVYLMGFSAGGDGTYQLAERIPHLLAACSPQGGHPNGVNTINICNCPMYLAAGEKDGAFKRNEICVEYYKQIMAQNGKYLGHYNAKVEVVGGSPHSFQCWKTPRKSFFNGSKQLSQTNETAFTFMYSHTRNPYPTDISLDKKTFLTKLRNYYTPRGNTFYNIEVGKNTTDMIQVQINYNANTITVKEGDNFRINLLSGLFPRGDVVTVNDKGKTTQYKLQRDANYAKNNMKLFCDPNYGFDSYINIGNFQPEVNVGYVPQAPTTASQGRKPPQQMSGYQQPQMSGYQQPQIPGYQQPQIPGYQQGYPQVVYPGSQIGYQQGYGQGYPGMQNPYGFQQQQFGYMGPGRRQPNFGYGQQQYYY